MTKEDFKTIKYCKWDENLAKLGIKIYEYTKEFIEKHKEEGIIWYFDVYSCTTLDFYCGLLKMKYAGLFTNCKGILIGRVAAPDKSNPELDYIKAADKALGNIPHICEMDIGHSLPRMTMINGAIINVKYKNNKGSISFKLK